MLFFCCLKTLFLFKGETKRTNEKRKIKSDFLAGSVLKNNICIMNYERLAVEGRFKGIFVFRFQLRSATLRCLKRSKTSRNKCENSRALTCGFFFHLPDHAVQKMSLDANVS